MPRKLEYIQKCNHPCGISAFNVAFSFIFPNHLETHCEEAYQMPRKLEYIKYCNHPCGLDAFNVDYFSVLFLQHLNTLGAFSRSLIMTIIHFQKNMSLQRQLREDDKPDLLPHCPLSPGYIICFPLHLHYTIPYESQVKRKGIMFLWCQTCIKHSFSISHHLSVHFHHCEVTNI